MAQIALARVDSRLLHAQVLVSWVQQCEVDRIVIADDGIAADPFLIKLFEMSAPPRVALSILNIDDTVTFLKQSEGRVLILFKNLLMLRAAIKAKMPLEDVQIAGLGAKTDSVQVFRTVHITQAEAEMLMHYHTTRNLKVYFQAEPQENAVPLHEAVATYFPELAK